MNFKEKAIENLIRYKKEKLKITKDGKYNYQGKIVLKPQILPKGLENKNFIQDITTNKLLEKDGIKLHRYYYHLNSSQAMCINFFEKIRHNQDVFRRLIKDTLNIDLEGEIKSRFEYEDENNKEEGTNFDFFVECGKTKIYWEIKYTEGEFATTKANKKTHTGESHLAKYNRVYKDLFKTTKYLKDLTMDEFFNNYQIYRNISYVKDDNQYSIFLYPKADEKLNKQIEDVIEKHKCQSNVYAIDWKYIYEKLFNIIKDNEEYKKYYLEFKDKYLEY